MSESNRVKMRAKRESVLGTTPTDASGWIEVRETGDSLTAEPTTVVSGEILSSRMESDVINVGLDVEGAVEIEQSHGSHDELLEAAFANAWSANVLKIGTTQYSYTIEKEYEDIAFQGTLSGTTGSGQALIDDASVSVGQTTIDLDDTSLTGTIVAGDGFTVAGDTQIYTCRGTVTASANAISSMAFSPAAKVAWSDDAILTLVNPKYLAMKGLVSNGFTMSWEYGQICTGSFSFMGTGKAIGTSSLVGSGSVDARATTTPFNASSGMTSIQIDSGDSGTKIRKLDLTLSNGLRPVENMGQEAPTDYEFGVAAVNGTLEVYLNSLSNLYGALINNEEFALSWVTTDVDGNTWTWSVPRCKALSGAPDTPGKDDSVMLNLGFQALYDSSSSTSVSLTRSA